MLETDGAPILSMDGRVPGGSGFRVPGSRFLVRGLGFGVWSSRFRVSIFGFLVRGSEFGVLGSGFRVRGLGLGVRVWGREGGNEKERVCVFGGVECRGIMSRRVRV